MRKMACMSRPLALADPVPLTVAILKAKSLMRSMTSMTVDAESACDAARASCCATACRTALHTAAMRLTCRRVARVRNLQLELPHVPRGGRAALGAQAAVQADVLVLDHHPAGLLAAARTRTAAARGCRPAPAAAPRRSGSSPFGVIVRQSTGTDVDAGVALDAQRVGEVRLDVAVQAALDLARVCSAVKPSSTSIVMLREAHRQLDVLHLLALRRVVVVAVGPLVQPHLRARQLHPLRRPLGERHALAVVVDRDRRLMPVLDGPDDVRRPERRVAAEEHAGPRRHERRLVDDRHVPLVELEADVALDPRERVVLADREDDRVAREDLAADDFLLQPRCRSRPTGTCRTPCRSSLPFSMTKRTGCEVLDDLDALFLGVLELPRRGLEVLARLARDDLDVLGAEALATSGSSPSPCCRRR